jgi:protein-ribulosamine 3-kinase
VVVFLAVFVAGSREPGDSRELHSIHMVIRCGFVAAATPSSVVPAARSHSASCLRKAGLGLRLSRRCSTSLAAPQPLVTMQTRQDFGTSTTDEIAAFITDNLGRGKVTRMQRAGSSGWAIMHKATTASGMRFFIKVCRGDEEMFTGEAEGLQAMYHTGTLRVPEVFHYGPLKNGKGAFIVMEQLDLGAIYTQSDLGRLVAEMHLAEPTVAEAKAGKFGFGVENTIGGTLQPNSWMDDWVEFFRERRLRHQLLLSGDDDLYKVGMKVCERMGDFFEGAGEIRPSILHGDLWSGNIGSADGAPVVYDPACYFGHHEAEFGMSWCAGFTPKFWEAYHALIPRAPGFKDRHDLYTAYHALNHFNLFGGGYKAMALACLNRLL